MLYEAACWRPQRPGPPKDEVLSDPHIARYHEGWGRPGDAAVIAAADGEPVGAAWYRLFDVEKPGYGFVAANVPELSIGVASEHRGRGVGSALLAALMDLARERGFDALSLSVEEDNPALRLYERSGFRRVFREGNAWTLLANLR
jgi:ribosomal protein S18 acetylase RimI-like enzyme